MRALHIKAGDVLLEQVDVDPDNFASFASYVNDDMPEVVRGTMLYEANAVMVVADNGHALDLPVNSIGSFLYGTQIHGHWIVGDVLLIGERMGGEGAEFCDLPEGVEERLAVLLDAMA